MRRAIGERDDYAPEVERSVREGDGETLERIRLRFSGALDLFALE